MNKSVVITEAVTVAVAIGGFIVYKIARRKSETEDDAQKEDSDIIESTVSNADKVQEQRDDSAGDKWLVAPGDNAILREDASKPSMEELCKKYENITNTYTEEDQEEEQKVPENWNVFDNMDKSLETEEEEYKKEDAVPPSRREKITPSAMDILQISAKQYRDESGYEKCVCTYYTNDRILAGCNNNLDVMNPAETVGSSIIDLFDSDTNIDTVYVTNIANQTDYEINQSYDSYADDYNEICNGANGDEACMVEKE